MKSTESGNFGFNLRMGPFMYHLLGFRSLNNSVPNHSASNHLFMRSESEEGLRSDIMNVEFGFVALAIGASMNE
jgi:hypothetical protein